MNSNFKRIPITVPGYRPYEGRLFEEKPKIKEYYNFKKNVGIDYRRLTPGSRQLIWLKCPVCGYEWQTEVRHFTGCNCCAGNVIMPGFNDVATLFPELLLDFDPALNPEINLSEEPFSSKKIVTWVCHKCGHKWTAQIYSRIAHEGSRKYVTMCKKCLVLKERQEKHSEVFQYLDLTKNTPYEMASDGKLEFICPDHGSFKKTWTEMIKYYNQNGCLPCCKAGKLPKPKKEGVKYLSDYTELVKEYSPNNTKSPDELTENSSCVVGWFCQKHGEYHMQVRYRTIHGRGCPTCRDENNYFYAHRDEIEKIYSPKNKKPFSDIRAYSDEEIILVCEKGHEFTKKPSSISSYKTYSCPTCQKITAFENFRASILGAHENIKDLWDEEKNYDYYVTQNNPFDNWYQFWGKCDAGHEGFFDVRAIARNGGTCPYCGNRKLMVGFNDIATVNPALLEKVAKEYRESASQMIYDPNKVLMLECPDCHGIYQDTIANIENGVNNCPYCAGKKVLSGFNDVKTVSSKVYERLATINKNLADSILYKPDRILTFECPDCHGEYDDMIINIENGINNCPYCAGLKVLKGFNDLATVKPEIAKRLGKAYREKTSEMLYEPERIVPFECPDCHGEYSDTMTNIDKGIKNCPYCAGKKALKGFNDLGTVRPDLKEKWSDKNDRPFEDFTPNNTYLGTWRCDECGGEFERSINDMCKDDSCPYCTNKKVLPGYNDVLTLYPALADEAYEIGNYMIGINMNELLPTSTKKGYFQCPDCKKAYSMRICDRVEKLERGHRACPRCNLISKKKKFVF